MPSACSLHVSCVLHLASHFGGLGCEHLLPCSLSYHLPCLHLASHVGGLGCVHLFPCSLSNHLPGHVGSFGSENLLCHVSGLGCEHVGGLSCKNLLRHVGSFGCENFLCHVSGLCSLGCENLLCHVSGLCSLGCENLLSHVSGLGCVDLLRHVSGLLHLTSSFIFQRPHGLYFLDDFLTGWCVACVILHRTLLARFFSDKFFLARFFGDDLLRFLSGLHSLLFHLLDGSSLSYFLIDDVFLADLRLRVILQRFIRGFLLGWLVVRVLGLVVLGDLLITQHHHGLLLNILWLRSFPFPGSSE